jgi:hypothetical protein
VPKAFVDDITSLKSELRSLKGELEKKSEGVIPVGRSTGSLEPPRAMAPKALPSAKALHATTPKAAALAKAAHATNLVRPPPVVVPLGEAVVSNPTNAFSLSVVAATNAGSSVPLQKFVEGAAVIA